ncbi:peptidoglycan-binding protein [Peteryoungia ipomoeae]|uniref:Peptidoglycan-binding protein n=1 Tax=Peteryoungia ipomoeae TaxID=1210932 RepID=A0A4S8P7E8_9HYPH|nr:peptidoglycan-binding protein [Peteryoungia ipomoeae]THV23834.1 peptidoglycan-binding protein [Peteryoungia ipomoeae]
MNGSRSPSQRPGGPSSLDALSRTIEGLEARIGDLMEQSGRRRPDEPPRGESPFRPDPLREIRERQRALEESRLRAAEGAGAIRQPDAALQPRAPLREPAPALREPYARDPQPGFDNRPALRPAERQATDFAHALLGLRQDLKKDFADSLNREVVGLREEMRSIRALAEATRPGDDLRADIERLADSIHHLDSARSPETEGLREDFNQLRSLMDGLAREDSVQRMERRWSDVEVRLDQFDPEAIREEILRLADRLDAMKVQLGGLADRNAITVLEDKLISVAAALEQISAQIDPNERLVMEQFAGLDLRLDEISRAIAASRNNAANDPASFQRLEERLASMATQIDDFTTRPAADDHASRELAERLEILSQRIEQLSAEQSVLRVEERIDQLSAYLEQHHQPQELPDLTGYLADISRKIDAMDYGSTHDLLTDRLEALTLRIEEMERPVATQAVDDSALRSLEGRLTAVVDRLEESQGNQSGFETASLRGLEEQIAHLSTLISQPMAAQPDVADRISALEDYVATSDEYIIEAARQAAETVMANFAQYSGATGGASATDIGVLTALADHLKQLEEYSRHSEERTHRTFEALHDTLVQIAGRLDELHEGARHDGPQVDDVSQPEPRRWADEEAAYTVPPTRDHAAEARHNDPAPSVAWEQPAARYEVAEPVSTAPDSIPAPAPEPAYAYHQEEEAQPTAKLDHGATIPEVVVSTGERETASAKPSLLAGLGRKIMPGRKEPAAPDAADAPSTSPEGRQVISPAPSIDPVEVLRPDDTNELLEPGSGAPDVRKILERVRASQQQAARQAATTETRDDRADYIAAARRAAQAAAMEMNRAQKTAASGDDAAASGAGEAGKTSLLGRYRRPILIAVGAVLLAAMAMPLVNTFLQPANVIAIDAPTQDAPEGAPDETSALDAPAIGAAVAGDAIAAGDAGNVAAADAETATAPFGRPVETQPEPLVASAMAGGDSAAPVEGTNMEAASSTPVTDAPSDAQAASAEIANAASAAQPVADSAISIEVPAAITPASLVEAAKRGDAVALFEIGARFTDGRGVPSDFAEAAKWYRLSADRGFALAQYRLANFLEKGTGLPADPAEAKRYYELAASAGNASAMHNLAVMHASGRDGTPDYGKAVEWFTQAAEHGVSDSQFNLAILLARGNGAGQDLAGSYKWFAIAAKGGDADAAEKRDEVGKALQPADLERAKAEVDAWKAREPDLDSNTANMPDEWAGKGLKTSSVDMKKAVTNIQAILNKNGFDAGKPDGVMGEKTVTAIKAFQASKGLAPTGQVDDKLVSALLTNNK